MNEPGAHLVLLMDVAEARAHWLDALQDGIRHRLRAARIPFSRIAPAGSVLQVRLTRPEDADAALKALADLAPAAPSGSLGSRENDVTVVKREGGNITIAPTEAGAERRTSAVLDDIAAIAGRRLRGAGVIASIVPLGRDQIHVHAPALQDTAALKELMTRSARLTFHEVHPVLNAEHARQGRVPLGFKIYSAPLGELLLRERPVIQGIELIDAYVLLDERTKQPVIGFRFNRIGAYVFAKFTSERIGHPFAIVHDSVVLAAPIIREPIGESGQVSGNFTAEAARQLAVLLRAGALPAKLAVVEQRVVPRGG